MRHTEVLLEEMKKIGFNAYEAMAYIGLLKKNPVSRYELSQISGVPQSKIYEIIERLQEKNVVIVIENDPPLYIPMPPGDLISIISKEYSLAFSSLEKGLTQISQKSLNDYILNLNNYDSIILKAKYIVDITSENLLISCWPDELDLLMPNLKHLHDKKVKITIIGYNLDTSFGYGKVFTHGITEEVEGERGKQLIAVNEKIALMAVLGNNPHGLWTKSKELIQLYKEYILHEIYLWRVLNDYKEQIRFRYGENLEKLKDL